MRKALPLLLLPLLAAPAAAQDFEGTIAMTMTSAEMPEPLAVRLYLTADKQAMVMAMPSSAGPMAGKEVRMVVNPAAGKITTLMPPPPGMPAKGMKMVMDFSSVAAEAEAANVKVTPLGSSQVIVGMSCDDYEIVTEEQTVKVCVSRELGRYRFPEMTGARPEMPGWVKAFGDKPAFPLKVWTDDGSLTMEVTAVERGPVSGEILDDNPEGFMSVPGMGG